MLFIDYQSSEKAKSLSLRRHPHVPLTYSISDVIFSVLSPCHPFRNTTVHSDSKDLFDSSSLWKNLPSFMLLAHCLITIHCTQMVPLNDFLSSDALFPFPPLLFVVEFSTIWHKTHILCDTIYCLFHITRIWTPWRSYNLNVLFIAFTCTYTCT